MTYRAHVKNGQIVLDEPVQLREGAPLMVIEGAVPGDSNRSLADYVSQLPPGTRSKPEIDRQIFEERDSWEGR